MDERAVDPPRNDANWRRISKSSHLPKSTGSTLERQLTAPTAPAGGTIATAAVTGQPQGDHKDPDLAMQYLI
tara:strand:- start:34 stop:249 length:216 start_codon:yes stop_codon:yes gene_type:complete